MGEVQLPDVHEIEQQSFPIVAQANGFEVIDKASLDSAAELMQECKRWQKEVRATFGPAKQAAHDAHKKIIAAEREKLQPFEEAERTLKQKTGAYIQAENRRIAEERRKAEAEARAKEEARRQEEMRRVRAEAARAAKAAATKREAERIRRDAQQAAAEVKAAPVALEVPEVEEAPKASGVVSRTVRKFRIVDVNKIPRKFMVPDEVKIRKVVQALGADADIPGVEVYEENQVAVRA